MTFLQFKWTWIVTGVLLLYMLPICQTGKKEKVFKGKSKSKSQSSNDKFRKVVLKAHNILRRNEGASDMLEMIWNPCLADMAQDWADGCIFEHGQPSRDFPNRIKGHLGQNLYLSTDTESSSIESINVSIYAYYSEKPFWNFNQNTCQSNQMCGHYTQLVWAKTQMVGCAIKDCEKIQFGNGETRKGRLGVCNYYQGGNVYSNTGMLPMFVPGAACSKCPEGAKCRKGLCSVPVPKIKLKSCPSGVNSTGAKETKNGKKSAKSLSRGGRTTNGDKKKKKKKKEKKKKHLDQPLCFSGIESQKNISLRLS